MPTNGLQRNEYSVSITTTEPFQLTVSGYSRYIIVISYDYNKKHSLFLVDKYGVITISDDLSNYLSFDLQDSIFTATAKFGSVGCRITVLKF